MRWRNPICTLPMVEPVANQLAAEFAEQPIRRRIQALCKAGAREVGLTLSRQVGLRVGSVPRGTRTMLWIYTWTTVGDAIMDLAPRVLVPPGIAVDLLIEPALAPLFASDRRLRAVHDDVASCGDTDFVLLDTLRTTALRLKTRHFPAQPFASMREHQAGERFDRVAYADRRIRQLFGLAGGAVVQPALDLGLPPRAPFDGSRFNVALPLGARVAGKRYSHWAVLLRRLVAEWPKAIASPRFHLLGHGASARADLAQIDPGWLERHASVLIDSGDLRKAAFDIAACDAFLGVDGGLMHVAVGVGTPGLALFAAVDPAYFLRPESTMQALRGDREVSELHPAHVARRFLDVLPSFLTLRRR